MNTKINHLAVWILIVVYFFIGWGWYAILGEKWLNLHARTMTDIERTHNVSAYVLAFIAAVVVNYTLAILFSRLNVTSALYGLKIALACWFAFLFMEYATISVFSAFETNPWPLICIDMGRPLLAFAVSGLVLGAWRKRTASESALGLCLTNLSWSHNLRNRFSCCLRWPTATA